MRFGNIRTVACESKVGRPGSRWSSANWVWQVLISELLSRVYGNLGKLVPQYVDAKEDNSIQLGARKHSIFCIRVVRSTGATYYICLGSYHIYCNIIECMNDGYTERT